MHVEVSIIVPVYNAALTLRRCIDSIIKQTYIDYEVLLINDGSTDISGNICDEYARKYSNIKVVHQENNGVSVARNVGLNLVSGKWVVFCDSDDYVRADWLSNLLMIKTRPQGVLIVNAINLLNDEGYIGMKGGEYGFTTDTRKGIMLLKNSDTLGYLFNKIFNIQIIRNNNLKFDSCLRFREDEDFVLKYLKNINQIVYIPTADYNYFIPDLSSKYGKVQMFDASLSMYVSIIKIYHNENNEMCDKYRRELINAFFDTYRFGNSSPRNISRLYQVLTINQVKPYVSFITYLILKLPKVLCNLLLLIKSRIYNFRLLLMR